MTLPNFLIIGAGRSGTTSLYHYLGQHPEIFMSPVKETNFFAWQASGPDAQEEALAKPRVNFPIRTLEAYQELYREAHGHSAIGEASPTSMTVDGVPQAIEASIAEAKIIAVLRDPRIRAFKSWLGQTEAGREKRSFAQCINDELPLLNLPVTINDMAYVRTGLYHRHMSRFRNYFPDSHILTILYDDFECNPKTIVRDILEFLSVDPEVDIDIRVRHNPTGVPKNMALDRLTAKSPLSQTLKSWVPRPVRDPLYRLAMHARAQNRAPAAMPMDMQQRLADIYRDDTEALAKLLNRNLSSWMQSPKGAH